MATALLGAELAGRGESGIEVRSAGLLGGGVAPPEEAIEAMQDLGMDIAAHRSREVSSADLIEASLVLTMTGQQLVEVIWREPDAWTRMFTLAEANRRASAAGPRGRVESVAAWAKRLGDGRSRTELLSLPPAEDIPDPVGGSRKEFEEVRDMLSRHVASLANVLVPRLTGFEPVYQS